ncbi:Pentachlorophenol monooxygenase [Sphingobium chlorophenolicum L-1]|uniref:Pentachlorophenol monooxygenase n=1 Tax=Sphingobium chlorophenolicum L-1 TaxID=690566 RepID=F6F3P0_SPHCR|nr:FAD-dependent monooxygenase [Sphingobium chlorophenolicum]AEG51052.1 Pentachlorophenol monooxygenase [Sphingobium chlorophenolicum L-1]
MSTYPINAPGQSADAAVLIVGGGPTGLIAANELLRRGVSCRMIDRLPVAHQTSKSCTIHARSMEMMEHIGIAARYIETGVRSNGFTFNFENTDAKPLLDFSVLPGRYPFITIYNQNETERVLRQHLEATYSFQPEWGTQLLALNQDENGIRADLRLKDGTKQTISPRWVIGADGVRSRVRECLGIAYEGEDYEENVLQMMDVGIQDFEAGDDWIHYFIGQDKFVFVTKLPGSNYRVIISDLGGANKSNLEETREAFQGYLSSFDDHATLDEPRWATKWRVWKRMATAYRKGNVFLAGDAAHCHSPSGGSGMNVGMQDAFNLGWKIAMVERGEAKPDLLDTYHTERTPVAQQLLEGTHAMHEIIMGHGKGLTDRIELTQAPGWHDAATYRVSGMSYNYRDQLVSFNDDRLAGPSAGDRIPDAELAPRIRLFDLVRNTRPTLLLAPATEAEVAEAEKLRDLIREQWPLVKPVLVRPQGSEESIEGDVHVDSYGQLKREWGDNAKGWAALLRPDNYIHARAGLDRGDLLVQAIDAMLVRCA